MFTSLKQSLTAWAETTSDRVKLQHTYVVVTIALVVAAGVLGLLNRSIGQQILAVAIASAAIFLVNGVVWALLQSLVLFKVMSVDRIIETRTAATRSVSKRKKP